MKLDRYMVNLFFEIKRNLPLSQQKDMLISSPSIGTIMTNIQQITDDENIKLLINVFLERADQNNSSDLAKSSRPPSLIKKIMSPTIPKNIGSTKAVSNKKSQRIYRGQIVED